MSDLPDINVPWPDAGHEAIRQAMVAAIAEQADHLEQLADSFLLGQTAADFAQTVLVNFGTLSQTVTDQATTIAALQQTVTDLQTTVTAQADTITALQTQANDLDARVTVLETPTPAA